MKINIPDYCDLNEIYLDRECLLNDVKEKLKIDIDNECSYLFDMVEDKKINISFEDIINTIVDFIINDIESLNQKEV